MKHELRDNYGKRAYTEIQDIKKIIDVKNANNMTHYSSNNLTYNIISSELEINKYTTIVANKSMGYVNIYVENVTNVQNCNVEIKNNDMPIYYGKLCNVKVDFVYSTTNNISISINNLDKVFIKATFEFSGDIITQNNKSIIDTLGNKIYTAYSGFGETHICVSSSIDNMKNSVYEACYTLPIELLDMKAITDSRLYTGTTIIVAGKDSDSKLVYYNSGDNFASNTILIDRCDTAKISADKKEFCMYCLLNSKLYYLYYNNNLEINVSKCILGRDYNFTSLYTANSCHIFGEPQTLIIAQDKSKDMYLISHESKFVNGELDKETFVLKYLANADNASISILDTGIIYAYITLCSETIKYTVEYRKAEKRLILEEVSRYCPCDACINLAYGQVRKYKTNILVE